MMIPNSLEIEVLEIIWVVIQCIDIFSNQQQPASLLKKGRFKQTVSKNSFSTQKHSVMQVLIQALADIQPSTRVSLRKKIISAPHTPT